MARVKGGGMRGWRLSIINQTRVSEETETHEQRNVEPGVTDGGVKAQRCDCDR